MFILNFNTGIVTSNDGVITLGSSIGDEPKIDTPTVRPRIVNDAVRPSNVDDANLAKPLHGALTLHGKGQHPPRVATSDMEVRS